MAFSVAVTANAQVELMEFAPPLREMAGRLLSLLEDDLWRNERKDDIGLSDGEGEDALPVFAASHEIVVAWFVEDEEAEEVVVLHLARLSRFRYP